jgi:hypothetical protein
MSTEAGPRQTTFALSGILDRSSARAIKGAVRGIDREAVVRISRPAHLVCVRSTAPVEAIRRVIRDVGFHLELTTRPFPQAAELPVVGWTLIGAIVTPIITFILVLIMIRIDPACGAPGDSGGCDAGLADLTVISVLPGAALGLGLALGRGLWSRWRRTPAGRQAGSPLGKPYQSRRRPRRIASMASRTASTLAAASNAVITALAGKR